MNTPNTNDFSVAKVGEQLWLRANNYEGPCEVVSRGQWMIQIKTANGYLWLAANGCLASGPQCLFWSKPEIIAPPRPKRMVKKLVEVRPYWISDLKNTFGILVDASNASDVRWCGPVQPIEILVEEE